MAGGGVGGSNFMRSCSVTSCPDEVIMLSAVSALYLFQAFESVLYAPICLPSLNTRYATSTDGCVGTGAGDVAGGVGLFGCKFGQSYTMSACGVILPVLRNCTT